jgi:hypothetical protein
MENRYKFPLLEPFETDLREATLWFNVPFPLSSWVLSLQNDDGADFVYTNIRVGLVPLSLKFWIQTFLFLCLQSVANIVLAIVVYHLIVKPQEEEKKRQSFEATKLKALSSISPFVIGYGIICPLLLAWPFFLCGTIMEMYNIAMMLCLVGAVPNLLLLRVTEAIHGLLPDFCYESSPTPCLPKDGSSGSTKSPFLMLLCYYSASLQFQFDPKSHQPIPLTQALLWKKGKKFVSVFLQTSLLYSVLLPYDYQLFKAPNLQEQTTVLSTLWCFLHPFKLANALLMASLLSLVLESKFHYILAVSRLSTACFTSIYSLSVLFACRWCFGTRFTFLAVYWSGHGKLLGGTTHSVDVSVGFLGASLGSPGSLSIETRGISSHETGWTFEKRGITSYIPFVRSNS